MFHKKHFTCNMHNREKGDIGENMACGFIISKGFTIIDRNYLKKWGELDIVARKDGVIHFFEVKSVIDGSFKDLDGYRPEDNVHNLKVRTLRRTVQTYLVEKSIGLDAQFYFHVLAVFIDMKNRKGRVRWIENVIL